MNVSVGIKIKSLRKQKGITQEQLANTFSLSTQAVSKWENNIALPDITIIPALASFFDVSIDELFDYHLHEKKQNIKSICDKASKSRDSDPEKARELIEEGLKHYPDNDILLINLLYTINYSTHSDTTIAIASKLIAETMDTEVRYDALRFLAYGYKAKGEFANAMAAIEQIPEVYFTRLSELAFVTIGTVKYDAAEKQKWISFEMIIQMMKIIIEFHVEEENSEAVLLEAKRALTIINALADEDKINRFQYYKDHFNQILDSNS